MEPVVIVGVGMMTAVGLSAPETAASVRAVTARFDSVPYLDKRSDHFTAAMVPKDALPPLDDALERAAGLASRERRMLRLATLPLRECLARLPESARGGALPLCLAMSESQPRRPLEPSAFLQYLATQVGGAIDPDRSDASHTGRAGGLLAVGQAVLTVQQGAPFVVAGGIDTYLDPYVLGTLDAEARVKSRANLDGFIPGEGAAFVLLTSARTATTYSLTPFAQVSPVATGFEQGHLYSEEPYKGDGLAQTIAALAATSGAPAPFQEVFSSMNGESHWAKEWGVARTRNGGAFDATHGLHHPADCYGDTGAAAGPLMIGLAALGVRATSRRSPALVYGSSDHGQRAAVAISSI